MNCQIEFANDDVGMPCGKPAVAKCSDCGSAICSDCWYLPELSTKLDWDTSYCAPVRTGWTAYSQRPS